MQFSWLVQYLTSPKSKQISCQFLNKIKILNNNWFLIMRFLFFLSYEFMMVHYHVIWTILVHHQVTLKSRKRGPGSNGTANRLKPRASPVSIGSFHASLALGEAVPGVCTAGDVGQQLHSRLYPVRRRCHRAPSTHIRRSAVSNGMDVPTL